MPNGATDQDIREAAGKRAHRFHDVAVAVAAIERAAQLSQTAERRAARLPLAAASAFDMGRHEIVTRLMQEVEPLDVSAIQRAHMS